MSLPCLFSRHWNRFAVICSTEYGLGWNVAQVWFGHGRPRGRFKWRWISCTSSQRQWIVHGAQYTAHEANSCVDSSTKWWISKAAMCWSRHCSLCRHSCHHLMSLFCFWNFLLFLWWEYLDAFDWDWHLILYLIFSEIFRYTLVILIFYTVIHRVKWRHISVVAVRSPFCGATPSYCVTSLNWWRCRVIRLKLHQLVYENVRISAILLRKWCLNKKCFAELALQNGGKTAGIDMIWRNYVTVILCIAYW